MKVFENKKKVVAVLVTAAALGACGGSSDSSGDTTAVKVKNAALTTTVPSKNCAQGGACKVGDIGPGGGKVFYVDANAVSVYGAKYKGGKYLEFISPSGDKLVNFKCAYSPGNLAIGLGSGPQNTSQYFEYCKLKDIDAPIVLAYNAKNGGKSDWYLPSFGELNLICRFSRGASTATNEPCAEIGQGSQLPGKEFAVGQWSSTPVSKTEMSVLMFGTGEQTKAVKTTGFNAYFFVRAFG